jgi:pentatricopeptide repeat protein
MMVDEYAMQPNAIVLGCMLDALVCNNQVEDAVILLGKWKAKIAPNTIMYSTIIKGFANSRQASRALDMWEEITSLGVTFNNVLFNALIDSQARVGAMDKVSMLVESMEPNGCAPDSITYATIVKGYCVQGDLDRAFEAFRSAQKNGMAIDSVVYNTIMSGCTRHNRVDLAGMVLEDMEKYGIKPSSSTLGILVKMYVQCRQLDKAFQVAEEFPRKHGVQVNVQARTCLLDACLGSNNIDRAMKIFDEIKASGEGVDAKTYSSVISGLVRHGRLERAAALVDEAYGLTGKSARGRLLSDQKLDSESLEQLVQALGQHQLMHSIGMPLLERLRAARVPVSGRLFALAVQ